MKKRIEVYDHYDVIHGHSFGQKQVKDPIRYEVKAWCVGGDMGILAYFFIHDHFCIASGDDGFWSLLYVCNKQWLTRIKEKINEIEGV